MCCQTNSSAHQGCSCQIGQFSNPVLWSRKKKLDSLNNMLDCLKTREQEIEEAITEIKDDK